MLGGAVVGWFSDVAEVCVLMSCLRVTSLSDGEASGVCCGGAVLNQDTAEAQANIIPSILGGGTQGRYTFVGKLLKVGTSANSG